MNTLFNHGIKQTQALSKDLAAFESNVVASPLSLQGTISTTLTAFRKTCTDYNDLLRQQQRPGAPQISGDLSKHEQRVAKFSLDAYAFATKFQDLRNQRESLLHDAGRQELLGRRAHIQKDPENPYDHDQAVRLQQHSMLYREGLLGEQESLSRGSQQLDYILEMGLHALQDMVSQNETLEKIKDKFETSLVTLGVSRGTIIKINKRAKEDKWLFYGGICMMLVCFWYILKLLR